MDFQTKTFRSWSRIENGRFYNGAHPSQLLSNQTSPSLATAAAQQCFALVCTSCAALCVQTRCRSLSKVHWISAMHDSSIAKVNQISLHNNLFLGSMDVLYVNELCGRHIRIKMLLKLVFWYMHPPPHPSVPLATAAPLDGLVTHSWQPPSLLMLPFQTHWKPLSNPPSPLQLHGLVTPPPTTNIDAPHPDETERASAAAAADPSSSP